jgi:hypothetical protein
VAVGLRFGDNFGREVAGGARPVVDHDRLAEAAAELVAEEPRQHVERAARPERHDQLDRLRRIGLRAHRARPRHECAGA